MLVAIVFGATALMLAILCNLHWPTQSEPIAALNLAMACFVSLVCMHAMRPQETRRLTLYVLIQCLFITLMIQTAFLLFQS